MLEEYIKRRGRRSSLQVAISVIRQSSVVGSREGSKLGNTVAGPWPLTMEEEGMEGMTE
jgi:hypothetical protein